MRDVFLGILAGCAILGVGVMILLAGSVAQIYTALQAQNDHYGVGSKGEPDAAADVKPDRIEVT